MGQIGLLFALYPGVWGAGQLITGALSDRIGRKHLITTGMTTQAAALVVIAASDGFAGWATGTVLLGAGTAMVYPTLLAVVGDVAHPAWRGRAVGVYRVWRDLGYAVGAVLGGDRRRPRGPARRGLGRRGHQRRLRPRRRGAHVRDPRPLLGRRSPVHGASSRRPDRWTATR